MNTFERRVKSFSIDTSLAFILLVLVAFGIQPPQEATEEVKEAYILWKKIIAMTCYFGVYLIPNLICKGQTLGRRVQKMKVVNVKTGETPHIIIILLRELVKAGLILFTGGFYVIIGGIVVNMREDGRTIHDFIFHTKVVPLTRYITDSKESYRSNTETMQKSLKGTSYYD